MTKSKCCGAEITTMMGHHEIVDYCTKCKESCERVSDLGSPIDREMAERMNRKLIPSPPAEGAEGAIERVGKDIVSNYGGEWSGDRELFLALLKRGIEIGEKRGVELARDIVRKELEALRIGVQLNYPATAIPFSVCNKLDNELTQLLARRG